MPELPEVEQYGAASSRWYAVGRRTPNVP